jgi:hypothetical protein
MSFGRKYDNGYEKKRENLSEKKEERRKIK